MLSHIFKIVLFLILFNFLQQSVFAFDIPIPGSIPQPVTTTAEADKSTQSIYNSIVTLVYIVGSIGALAYTMWGAIDWIFSGGDKEKVAGARKKITTALVGLTLLAVSFVIVFAVGKIVGIDFGKLPTITPLGSTK